MLAINQVLQERYRITRQLGQGGMGAVYEAQDERLGSLVALKEIIVEMDKIPTARQRELFLRAFEREAKLLANLHHEVFPRVMDYFSEENCQFLIMELVQGDDLGKLLTKNKTSFALATALQWADHLLDALDYLHTQTPPIFHRDIKPQNLKVTSRGKIKLLDFGIAKSVDQSGSTTASQTFVGATLEYSPIEQLLPSISTAFREFIVLKHPEKAKAVLKQNTDDRCDLYAMGATFYHLLTNRPPIDSTKRTLEIWEGNPDSLPNPSEINAEIPPAISGWLLKALEIDREHRFASALEMQKALQEAIAEAKAADKTTEKRIVLSKKKGYKSLSEAKTEQLIESAPTPPITETEVVPTTDPAPTEPAVTQSPLPELPVTEPTPLEKFETASVGQVSNLEFTAPSYLEGLLIEPEKPIVEDSLLVVTLQNETFAKSKLFWIIPIALIGILTVGGIGGIVWWNLPSNPPISNKSLSNTNVSIPTATVTPIPSPTAMPTSTPTPTDASNQVVKSSPTPKAAPTPKTTESITPPKTNTNSNKKPPQNTSSPKKTPELSDDCLYNKECNKKGNP